jgi:DNA-binding transcriptional regulator YiaG
MTRLSDPPTSAGEPITTKVVFQTLTSLLIVGTSSGFPAATAAQMRPFASRTDTGLPTATAPDTVSILTTLRRRSGLTWDQLAELFAVSRRSVHFWASGRPINAGHLVRLTEAAKLVKRLDHGDPGLTRAALFAPQPDGSTAFSRLKEGRYAECRSMCVPPPAYRPNLPPPAPVPSAPVAADVAMTTEWKPVHVEMPGRRTLAPRRRLPEA